MLQEQVKRSRGSIGSCFWNIKNVATIMVLCRATVPSVNSSCSPGGYIIWVQIKYRSCAWWGHRETIPVVSAAVELMTGRFTGVDARRAESVACYDRLFCNCIPQLE